LTAVPRVQGVVYFTRSLVEMENENVVNSAIEYVTTVQQTKMPYRVSPPVLPLTEQDRRRYAVRHIGAVHHVLVLHLHQRPPVLPLTELDIEEDSPLSGKFLKFMPSSFSSGCFIAAITREVRRTVPLLSNR